MSWRRSVLLLTRKSKSCKKESVARALPFSRGRPSCNNDAVGTPPVSPETRKRVALLFKPEEQEAACALLQDECGNNLPFMEDKDKIEMERLRFAAIKLSNGELNKLLNAVILAQADWRDLLVAAGFANDVHAHESWLPFGHN